jgi:glc operon protein GlcG
MTRFTKCLVIAMSIAAITDEAFAQSPAAPASFNPAAQMLPIDYGAPISNAKAKVVAAAALAEAKKMDLPMVVAITDTSGNLLYLEHMDGAILGGVLVAPQKARSAALYKRPTKAFEDSVAPGGVGLRFLRLEGAIPIEGGLPLILDNKIVGAIGMSGGTGVQDGAAAKAGADALK